MNWYATTQPFFPVSPIHHRHRASAVFACMLAAGVSSFCDPSAPGCGVGGPCIDQTVFGPSNLDYWSATSTGPNSDFAWYGNFFTANVSVDYKLESTFARWARAVRSGS